MSEAPLSTSQVIQDCLVLQMQRRKDLKTVKHTYYKTVHRRIPIAGTGKELYFAVDAAGSVEECIFNYWHNDSHQGEPHCTVYTCATPP